jgi:hypothetical protein
MSLALQNDVAQRLGYGGSRQAVIASALFGRSCRALEPVVREPLVRDRHQRAPGHRPRPEAGDGT